MTELTSVDIDSMPAGREMDALVAEFISMEGVRIETGPIIYGPMWKYNGGYREEFRPSTDISSDYSVFIAVCKWQKTNDIAYCKFWNELEKILNSRDNWQEFPVDWPMKMRFYRIGDYSRAALKAVMNDR